MSGNESRDRETFTFSLSVWLGFFLTIRNYFIIVKVNLLLAFLQVKQSGGTWLAQLVECATLAPWGRELERNVGSSLFRKKKKKNK